MVKQLITTPEQFLAQKVRFGRVREPFFIVLLAGIALSLRTIGSTLRLGPTASDLQIAVSVSFFIDILTPFLLWISLTIFFGIVSLIFSSRGSLGELFLALGWGFSPYVVTSLLWGVGRYIGLQGVVPPEVSQSVSGFPSQELPVYQEFNANAAGDPVFVIAIVVGILFFLWSSYLWMMAVQEVRAISRREATLTVVVPTLVYIGWVLSQTGLI